MIGDDVALSSRLFVFWPQIKAIRRVCMYAVAQKGTIERTANLQNFPFGPASAAEISNPHGRSWRLLITFLLRLNGASGRWRRVLVGVVLSLVIICVARSLELLQIRGIATLSSTIPVWTTAIIQEMS
jgi:hypothetical protein